MKHSINGFTLIEVMIAVLVLAFALGASLQAIGNYAGFQAALEQRYRTHLIAWNAVMECYASLRSKDEESCEYSGFIQQGDLYWDWEADEQEGELLFELANEEEIRMPLTIRSVRVLVPDSNAVASALTSILTNEWTGLAPDADVDDEDDEENEEPETESKESEKDS